MKLSRRVPRKALVLIGLSTLLWLPALKSTRIARASPYLERSHAISLNIYGGLGNATTGFNASAALYQGSNTVQSRIKARWPHGYAVGLQEVCQSQYNTIIFELAIDGYTSGPSGYRYTFVQSLKGLQT